MNYKEEKEQLELQNERRILRINELEASIKNHRSEIEKLGAEINFVYGQLDMLKKLIEEKD